MGHNSVAVLDIRSASASVLVGERGVNHTIVFHASHTESYDGFTNGSFYDKQSLTDAISASVAAVEKTMSRRIRKLYVGVPGAFLRVVPKTPQTGYPKKRRITDRETQGLFDAGRMEIPGYRFIHATSMIYVTADNRRVVNPRGLSSTSLTGWLSYYYCSNYFAETMEEIFKGMKIGLRYLPSEYAMASYLIPSETRDEYALLLDVGFLTTTLAVVIGGGIAAQKTYDVGRVQPCVSIMKACNLPYDAAMAVLEKANLYAKGGEPTEFLYDGQAYEIDPGCLAEATKDGLDEICEAISDFLEDCSTRELANKPLYVTGEGLADIRGALEHISRRVSRVCEPLVPDLPYYNKPSMSSRVALVDTAFEDNRKNGGLYRFFHFYGG